MYTCRTEYGAQHSEFEYGAKYTAGEPNTEIHIPKLQIVLNIEYWHASGPEFDPHVRHILLWRLGHENISTAILLLPLIQEEQLSVTGERMCTKYW